MSKKSKAPKSQPRDKVLDGVLTVNLSSWNDFFPYVNNKLPNPHDYVFRGQREAAWKIETTLDRTIREVGHGIDTQQHLKQFRLATRGRLHLNREELDADKTDRKWWALGQHFGLRTPLLDWTESPFVALYFAFEEPAAATPNAPRAVFALSRSLVTTVSNTTAYTQRESPSQPNILQIFTPETDENSRLVSQSGLFTSGTPGVDVEQWVQTAFRQTKSIALVKLVIPGDQQDRLDILRALNRMNINRSTLFPDVSGSAQFCNMRLLDSEY
jgi:hypothetical protein